jgi:hypothetical protein
MELLSHKMATTSGFEYATDDVADKLWEIVRTGGIPPGAHVTYEIRNSKKVIVIAHPSLSFDEIMYIVGFA